MRKVNIAGFVNELKVLYQRDGDRHLGSHRGGEDEAIRFPARYPGPGIGGHCIPIDPYYLTWVARQQGVPACACRISAGEINAAMPQPIVSCLDDRSICRFIAQRRSWSRILLLGMAWRSRDVGDARESPGLELAALLAKKEAEVGDTIRTSRMTDAR